MDFLHTFRIGRWFGFDVRIDVSWLAMFGLVALGLLAELLPEAVPGMGAAPRVMTAALVSLVFSLSLLGHELAHATVARRRGVGVVAITLFALGGVAEMTDEPESAIDDFLIASAGPAMSIALAATFATITFALPSNSTGVWAGPYVAAYYLAYINLAIALFNLFPAFPLDGGRILRAALWGWTGDVLRATRWAARTGQAFGYALFGLAGAIILVQGDVLGGVWIGLIGWFVKGAAEGHYRYVSLRHRLHGGRVDQVADQHFLTVRHDRSLTEAGRSLLGRTALSFAPVVEGHCMLGMLSAETVREAIEEGRGPEPVTSAMIDLADLERISHDTPLLDALQRLQQDDMGLLLVTRAGHVTGVLTPTMLHGWADRQGAHRTIAA